MPAAWRPAIVVLATPTLFITLPPLIWPHVLSFVVPFFVFILACAAFLCINAVVMRMRCINATGNLAPSLVIEDAPNPTQSFREESERMRPVSGDSVLNVVYLNDLHAALDSEAPESVLTRLYTTDELLRKRVRADEISFAIISYRQVRSKHDAFTMDVDAFVAAVARAHEAGIAALWLDAWCYRQEGPYVHAAFCAELSAVMRHVTSVIWLPRSRTGAPPSYQFRLWCSFEAGVVAQRKLPVYAAGQGLARSQHALRQLGCFLPALPGLELPNEIRALAYINGALALLCAVLPPVIPAVVVLLKAGAIEQAMPQYGLDAALAYNGQHVLRVMNEGMQRAVAGGQQRADKREVHLSSTRSQSSGSRFRRTLTARSTAREEETLMGSLGDMLPWLPAYDRRDALVVWNLIHAIAEAKLDVRRHNDTDEQLRALAASCFTAAIMEPSDGDRVGSLKIDAWLQQKGIMLRMDRPIRLTALDKHGWTVLRGSPDVLQCPAGRLRVPAPPTVATTGGSRWDASAMEPIAEPALSLQLVPILCCLTTVSMVFFVLFVTMIVDFRTTDYTRGEGVVLLSSLSGLTITLPICMLSVYSMAFSFFVLPWLYSHPHAAHVASVGAVFGKPVGYNALPDLGGVLLVALPVVAITGGLVIFVDTAAFSRETELFSSAFTAEMANASHPGVGVAPEAIALLLVVPHAWSLLWGLLASHVTWHMWNCGKRSGARCMLVSPDSKEKTVVSYLNVRCLVE